MALSQANATAELKWAMSAGNPSKLVIDKASIASQTALSYCSMWRATGQPGQGAIPTTAAVCSNALLGSFGVRQPVSPVASYGGLLWCQCSNAANVLEIHDRLMHIGGLVGNVATLQTVTGMDLSANLATSNLDKRKGDANYSDVQWWVEWYTTTGTTATTLTLTVTYNDDSSGTIAIPIAASRPASHMIAVNGLVPAAKSGFYIKAVTRAQCTASTGTAGDFGITATKQRMSLAMPAANLQYKDDWAALGLPTIDNSACLFMIVFTSTTSSGTLRGGGKIAHV